MVTLCRVGVTAINQFSLAVGKACASSGGEVKRGFFYFKARAARAGRVSFARPRVLLLCNSTPDRAAVYGKTINFTAERRRGAW